MVGRLGITDVTPVVGATGATFPARAVTGETVPIAATVFREGHDAVNADAVLRDPSGAKVALVRMQPGAPGTDRYEATIRCPARLWSATMKSIDVFDPFTGRKSTKHLTGVKTTKVSLPSHPIVLEIVHP